MSNDRRVDVSSDVTEISQVILAERQGRDRGWWDQMRAAFADDSLVRISWYHGDGAGFVAGSESMSGNGDTAVHRLSPPVVHVRGDRAIAEVPCGIEFRVEIDGVPADLASYTRLEYRLRRLSGGWKIAQMDAIYEHDTLIAAFPGDRVDVGSADVRGFRSSYALLAYYLRSKGYSVADDMLGDDRPDAVADFYTSLLDWLEGR